MNNSRSNDTAGTPTVPGDAVDGVERRRRDTAVVCFHGMVGPLMAEAKFSNFDVRDDAEKKQKARAAVYEAAQQWPLPSILVTGPPGCGKDHLLTAAARWVIVNRGSAVYWTNGAELLMRRRASFDGDARHDERQLLYELVGYDLLYLSDPAIADRDLNAGQKEFLYAVLDRRVRRATPTWVSCNATSPQQLAAMLGPANLDRVIQDAVHVVCTFGSYRARKEVYKC